MDRHSQPMFLRQPKSKAVPIRNPDGGEPLPRPVLQHKPPARILPAVPRLVPSNARPPSNTAPAVADRKEFPPLPGTLADSSDGEARPTSVSEQEHPARSLPAPLYPATNGKAPSGSRIQRDSPDSSSGHGHDFNVYARPFVPEAFSIINQLAGHEVNTLGNKQIDFEVYVGRCIGWDFLPPIPRPIGPPINVFSSLTDSIIHTGYEAYFRYHLEAEIQSHKQENESYALFGHDVTISVHDVTQTTCSFLAPGLQENSPYVEEDDIVQLRQLRYDHTGKLLGMEAWLARPITVPRSWLPFPPSGGRWRGEPAPGWTGMIYNARVVAVRRKDNTLVVKIDGGLDLRQSLLHSDASKFNIQFPVSNDRYLPMKHALPIIQEALKQANRARDHEYVAHKVASPSRASSSTTSQSSDRPIDLDGGRHTPWLQSMLFPIEADCDVQTTLNPASFNRVFFDQQLNWEQKKAIGSICTHNYGTLPFLVSGPPGTGKTKTLVEVALQLVKAVDGVSHVLFCAPSDPAADMIVQRISSHFNSNELLRLNRSSRTFAEVPGSVLPFCCISQDKFDLPKFRQLMACRLVVTTCRDASLLLHSRVTNVDLFAAEYGLRASINPLAAPPSQVELHWTALLIDEAAQAMEPEALIPLSVIAPPLGQLNLAFKPLVIMAGDEHQLGPRTSLPSSPLKTSLFARLFARPVYADHPLARGRTGERTPQVLKKTMLPIARPAFANLIRNYRSHPAILAVPSALFYADTLEPEATDTDRLTSWSVWQGRRWPVLFHNSDSEDERDLNGGWYNSGEAQVACAYAARLVQSGLVAQKEVCIMSPFKAQVAYFRRTVREPRFGSLWDVDIGPTEAFQGLERGVVILCTTRSKQQFVESDKKANWGLIGMPNKMNVALTRAKFGLIVIGKRDILLGDPNWRAFLDFCDRNGLVAGDTDRPVDDRDNVQLTRLEKVLLAHEHDSVDPDSKALKVVSQEDEMWMGGMQAALDAGSTDGYKNSDEEDYDDGNADEEDDENGRHIAPSTRFA
ncbi:P-loop containing nucleoside triphosphate hydrolase protein [Hyaloscypha variabilis]|jgi:hypothetical protein